MPTLLPKDLDDNAIHAVRFRNDGAHHVAVSDSSVRNDTAFAATTRIISLYATVPVFLRFGDGTVSADDNDHYFPAGIYYDVAVGGDKVPHFTHVATIRAGDEDGALYISEKE